MKDVWITLDDMDALALGAQVLGSGGGGDPGYDLLVAKAHMAEHGPVQLISVDDIPDHGWVLPIYWMGAPMVLLEKLHSGDEFGIIINKLKELIPCSFIGLMSAEIGGSNAMPPFYTAGILGLPVIDGDTMGRAFPMCYMSTCGLYDVKPGPGIIVATATGASVIVETETSAEMDRLLRALTIVMGSEAAVCSHPMPAAVAKKTVLRGSVSNALQLGRCIQSALVTGQDVPEVVLATYGGCLVAAGYISDIEYRLESAFQYGHAIIQGSDRRFTLCFQNEFLAVLESEGSIPLATTPDIIVVFENEIGLPIGVDRLRYGLRVRILALPAPQIWTTPEGLRLVGPEAFGLSWQYQSAELLCQNLV